MSRLPIVNCCVIGVTCLIFFFLLIGDTDALHVFILQDWGPLGIVGHMFLHGDIVHLIGKMLFLWVFGNAICAKVGNVAYIATYLGLGVLAAIVHLLADGAPAVRASGAINGIVRNIPCSISLE